MVHLAGLLSFFSVAIVSGEDFFLYPPRTGPHLSFSIGDTVNATWQNSDNNPKLVLWCTIQNTRNNDQTALSQVSGNGLKASGSYLFPLTYSNSDASDRCHFELTPGENSANFELKASEVGSSPTTWGIAQPTSSTSQTSSAASTTETSSTGTTTTSSTASSSADSTTTSVPITTPAPNTQSSGLSTGAKAGLGIGATLSFLALAAGVALVILGRTKKKKKANAAPEGKLMPTEMDCEQLAPKSELLAWNSVTECKSVSRTDGTVSELPGSTDRNDVRRA